MIELLARYIVGAKSLMAMSGQWNGKIADRFANQLQALASTPVDRLRVSVVLSVIQGEWPPSQKDLDRVEKESPALKDDVRLIRQLSTGASAISEAAWAGFEKRHGWVGKLARAQTLPEDAMERRVINRESQRTTLMMAGGFMLLAGLALTGLVFLIQAGLRWKKGLAAPRFVTPQAYSGGLLLEGFAVYIAFLTLVPLLLTRSFPGMATWAVYSVIGLGLVLTLVWPRWRSLNTREFRRCLGLHCGDGFVREIRAGFIGWMMGLPLLAVGVFLSSLIIEATGKFPNHPITEHFAEGGSSMWIMVALAVVWAPLTEEIAFRGMLLPGLSPWLGRLAALIVTAFLFAAIHPQGIAGIPPIMALATTLGTLRLWRGSLIAPMTVHAINNGIACIAMAVALG